jgi:homoserine kinase type II
MAPTASARPRDQIASLPQVDSEPQLIQNDYRASNVLTAGSEILVVLDFDGVAWDYCIRDLANAFVLLSTPFTDWQPTPASVRDTLLGGYQPARITHPARTPMAPSTRVVTRHQSHPSR